MPELLPEQQIALAEYTEVLTQFRKLTDIRFTLLMYLPLGTVFAAVFGASTVDVVRQRAISAFAFVVTICIATYDKRNDQHYDELVSRAAELERELQIEHGSFSDRPQSWLKYAFAPVEHRWPIGMIYAAAATLWAYLFVDTFGRDPSWLNAVPSWLIRFQPGLLRLQRSLVWLKVFVPVAAFVCWRGLRKMEKSREDKQREAVKGLMKRLREENLGHAELAEAIAAKPVLGIGMDKAKRRVAYHWKEYEQKQDARAASALLAAVIDLPARWIEDISSGRR